jgi:hypothetical protein
MKSVMSGDQLKEDRMALDNLLANLPQAKPGKSSSLDMTPYSTPQMSPATTPANKKNRLPIGKENLPYWGLFIYLFIYLFIICKYTVAVFRHSRRGRQISLWMDGCEPPCGCWDLNSGPLEEQSGALTH